MRKIIAFTSLAAIAAAVAFTALWAIEDTNKQGAAVAQTVADNATSKNMTIWRDPNCGCCDAYARYAEAKGYQVTLVDDRDFDKRSIAVGVPAQGLGCHLTEIGGYYISGLVPVEIIERLITERPAITGIMLPGMPSNAPGMAAEKTGTLKTYAFGGGDGFTVYSDE